MKCTSIFFFHNFSKPWFWFVMILVRQELKANQAGLYRRIRLCSIKTLFLILTVNEQRITRIPPLQTLALTISYHGADGKRMISQNEICLVWTCNDISCSIQSRSEPPILLHQGGRRNNFIRSGIWLRGKRRQAPKQTKFNGICCYPFALQITEPNTSIMLNDVPN
jgi:hypothetical protein